MSLYLLRVDLFDDVLRIPRLKCETLWIIRKLLNFLDLFVANNRLDLCVTVVDDQLLNSLVRHLALLGLICLIVLRVHSSDELVRDLTLAHR